MKKRSIALLLAALMVFAIAGTALAASVVIPDVTAGLQVNEGSENGNISRLKVMNLQGYDQLVQLRQQAVQSREQIKANQKTIKQLAKVASKGKNKNQEQIALLIAYRNNALQIKADLKALWATQKVNWTEMKAARKAKDTALMQSIFDTKILPTRQAINTKLLDFKAAQDQLITTLTTPPAPEPQP